MEVHKYAAALTVSREVIEDAGGFADAYHRYMNATDAERVQWAREAAERRAAERAEARRAPLSLDALLGKLGWSPEYATHFVQPYCACGDGPDGWDYCQHSRDLGV